MKLEHLSYSRIDKFDECPMRYRAEYELDMEAAPHPLTQVGEAIHKMFEVSSKARMVGARRAKLHDPFVLRDAAMRRAGVGEEMVPLVDELVQNGVRWGYFRNIGRAVGCELGFEFALSSGTIVAGVMDRLDLCLPSADIVDLKTGKKLPTQKELEKGWQARIYNVAVRRSCPEVTGPLCVSFWFLRHQVSRVWLTADDAKAAEDDMELKAEEIRSCTDPEPRPSGLCPWCPMSGNCEAECMGLKKSWNRRKR